MEVSTVSQNTPVTPTNATQSDAAAASIDYNAILRLLIAQMKNQDPTKPMDSAQFMAQLASFSNVEQGIKMNQKLESMLTVSSLTQADAVIGRTLTSADGTVTGVVKSVKVTDSGAVATLVSGKTVDLGAGIKIE